MIDARQGAARLARIKARGDAEPYRAEGMPIHLISIEFSREQCGVVAFETETLV